MPEYSDNTDPKNSWFTLSPHTFGLNMKHLKTITFNPNNVS